MAEKKTREPQYTSGDAQKGTTVDLNAANFKNQDVMKWTAPTNGPRKTSGAGKLAFGGSSLGGKKTRMHRKRGNRSNRAGGRRYA